MAANGNFWKNSRDLGVMDGLGRRARPADSAGRDAREHGPRGALATGSVDAMIPLCREGPGEKGIRDGPSRAGVAVGEVRRPRRPVRPEG